MSMPISRLSATILAAPLLLAACLPAVEVGRAAPSAVRVAGDSVVVAGPSGYCIDPRSSIDSGAEGAFVLMGSCAAISRSARAPRPAEPALVSVTVSETPSGISVAELSADLAAYFKSPEGRAALSRAGDPATVTILETRMFDGALYIRARDSSAGGGGMAAETWRAILNIGDRLLTVAVAGFAERPLSPSAGFATARDTARRIKAANG